MEQVILVNGNDEEIGLEEKVKAHLGQGKTHRAFVDFVFNDKGETLVAQRSAEKMLWPLFWDSACASHPRKGESYEEAGERRLQDELGFTCKMELVDKFQYQVPYENIGAENEVCATLFGTFNGEVNPNREEVADWKWVSIEDLGKDMKANPDIYAPWFIIAVDRLIEKGLVK